MKYRLGLDLGVTSVGSSVIALDKNNISEKIIDAGVVSLSCPRGQANVVSNEQPVKTLIEPAKDSKSLLIFCIKMAYG